MIWPEPPRARSLFRAARIGILAAIVFAAPPPAGGDEPVESQAWLLTYGPGEIYWQRFGHNAIWIRDPALGLDHTFNFGFFDFAQQGFLRNFLLGRLNYFAAARPAQVELAEYINDDRSIRAQRLDLSPGQLASLTEHLLLEVSAERREYLYDYYRHNCSTRIRDAIDIALGGALEREFAALPGRLNYRDHTRRLTGMDYWLYLGLETGLGSPVDRPVSAWDEMFIPGVLAVAAEAAVHPDSGRLLVVEDVMLHESSLSPPPHVPHSHWPRYLLLSALALIAAAFAVRIFSRVTARGLAVAWLSVGGLLGVVLAFLWCCTDHWVAALNLNLLLLNPLWLLIAVVPALRRPGAWLVVACGLLALASPWLPPGQYNADVVALILPLNLVAALSLLRNRKINR